MALFPIYLTVTGLKRESLFFHSHSTQILEYRRYATGCPRSLVNLSQTTKAICSSYIQPKRSYDKQSPVHRGMLLWQRQKIPNFQKTILKLPSCSLKSQFFHTSPSEWNQDSFKLSVSHFLP